MLILSPADARKQRYYSQTSIKGSLSRISQVTKLNRGLPFKRGDQNLGQYGAKIE